MSAAAGPQESDRRKVSKSIEDRNIWQGDQQQQRETKTLAMFSSRDERNIRTLQQGCEK
jgi:hypothetical protein